MTKFSLEKLSGKYSYECDGKICYGYGSCSNEEIATCEAENKNKAIEIFKTQIPTLDKNGYAQDNLISYCVAEILSK